MAKTQVALESKVTLELSEVEAGVLREILDLVGGDPNGPRGAADSIGKVLARLDIERVGKGVGNITIERAT